MVKKRENSPTVHPKTFVLDLMIETNRLEKYIGVFYDYS